jgi:phosphoribosylformylglycinamidine synthase
VNAGLAESAHDLSDGGLAVALAESSFGPAGIGARLELDSSLRPELLLFHEGPSRVLLSTAHPEKVAAIAAKHGVELLDAGVTIEKAIEIRNRGSKLAAWEIENLRSVWEGALQKALHVR